MERTATSGEVCAALGISDRTLRGWVTRGLAWSPAPKGRGRPGKLFSLDEARAFRDEHQLGIPGGGTRPDERPTLKVHAGESREAPAAPDAGAEARRELAQARAAKERTRAEKEQLELERARGTLAPVAEFRAFFERQVAIVKAHVAALPGRLAPQLVEQPYEEIHQALERALDAMLEAFAAGEMPGAAS